MSSEPWNLGSEKSNATLQLRQDYIYDAINEHLIGSGIVDATTFAAFASYLGYSSGGSVQDMQIAWTPTNLKLGEEIQFLGYSGIPGITSITFQQSTSLYGFDIESSTTLTTLSFPNLTGIEDPLLVIFGGLFIQNNTNLASISAPLLSIVAQNVGISGNTILASLNLSSLSDVGGTLIVSSNALVSLTLNALVTCGGLSAANNVGLTTVSLPIFVPTNGITIRFDGCSLNAASVNSILARCVANAGYVTGSVDLSGGTNAAPSGQGIADKATLIGRGVTVNTN